MRAGDRFESVSVRGQGGAGFSQQGGAVRGLAGGERDMARGKVAVGGADKSHHLLIVAGALSAICLTRAVGGHIG